MQIIRGVVQKGAGRGAILGYPTLNLALADRTLSGIYAARVYVGTETSYPAAVFADPVRSIIEAHVLDFSDNLYGLTATIELHRKIRDSEQFDTDDELRAAIAEDIAKVREYFKK